jgi:hypothetical protein
MNTMKEHKSHMSMVARFAYIFATIVTVFAQMGAAVPAMITDADNGTSTGEYGTADISGLTLTSFKSDYAVDMTIDGKMPANGQTFYIDLFGTGLEYLDSPTAAANGQVKGKYDYDLFSPWVVTPVAGNRLKVTRNDSYLPEVHSSAARTANAADNWGMHIKFLLLKNEGAGGAEISGGSAPAISYAETDTLKLADYNDQSNTDITYKVGDEIDLQTTDDDMVSEGAVNVIQQNVAPYLTYDYDKTVKLLSKMGYSEETVDAAGLQRADADAVVSDAHKFAKTDGTYFYLIDNGGDPNIAWPASDGKSQRVAAIATVAKAKTSSIPLTPKYIGTSLAGQDGTGLNLTITDPPKVDGSQMTFNPQAVGTLDGSPYRLSSFPMFYMKETSDSGQPLYSFMYDDASRGTSGGKTPTNSLENLRKGIIAGDAYGENISLGGSTSSAENASFENFHQIDPSTGDVVANTEQKFQDGKAYTLIPYHPVKGTTDRFQRIKSGYASERYYMPDGVPQISVDSNGNISLASTDDGNAVTGQWFTSGSQLGVNLYHVKQVKVIDQFGNPVKGATLTTKKTSGNSISLHGKTNSETGANGDLYPSDNPNFDDSQPFYYPEGTEAFDKLDLPAGYSQDIAFSAMTLNKDKDILSLSGEKNAEIVDQGQTLQLTVHKYTDADKQINIKKVSQSDTTKALGGATLHIEEVDGAGDAVPAQDITTADGTGLALIPGIDEASTTAKRIFHITETTAPKGYDKISEAGYFATWTKGTGFTAVGDTKDATTTSSSDSLANVDNNNQLTIEDPDSYYQGGSDSGMKIQYVDAAEYQAAGKGVKIEGAQLPVLKENNVYSGAGLLGFSGLGGVIYNPDSNPSDLTKADSGITTGTLKNDGSMYTSTEKSGTDGIGIVQQLWSQTGVVHGWEAIDQKSNGYILNNAIVNKTIPATPAIQYQLISPAQRQRAVGSAASGYYNLGSTLILSGDGKILTIGNASGSAKYNSKDRDNSISKTNNSNTAQVELYKVKHVRVVDTAGHTVPDATVKFSNMTATTGSDGSDAELLPNDVNNQPTTKGDNFVFPDGTQKLLSVTDSGKSALIGADGAALDTTNGFGFVMGNGGSDKLASPTSSAGKDVAISSDGQTITITVQAPTTIKIHKQDKANAETPVQGATFKVWADGDAEANAVETPNATDENGDTSVTLAKPSTNNLYHIKEVDAPEGYVADSKDYVFTWTAKDQVSAVTDDTKTVSTNNGTLDFADVAKAKMTIHKQDFNTKKGLDGATFSVAPKENASAKVTATTDADGNATFNFDQPSESGTYLVTETDAPDGYVVDSKEYTVSLNSNNAVTAVAGGGSKVAPATSDDTAHTGDLIFNDLKGGGGGGVGDNGSNGGTLTIDKIDSSTKKSLAGATFDVKEVDGSGSTIKSSSPSTTASTKATFDLGDPTTDERIFTIHESANPTGYAANGNTYRLRILPDGQMFLGAEDALANNIVDKQTQDGAITFASDTDHTLKFADTAVSNGGLFSLQKLDASNPTLALSGADFTLDEVGASGTTNIGEASTGTDGKLSFDLKSGTTATRYFKLLERTAPVGYLLNTTTYAIRITADGEVAVAKMDDSGVKTNADGTAVGDKKAADSATDISKLQYAQASPNGTVTVNGKGVTFLDTKTPDKNNGGTLKIKKTNFNDRTKGLAGANFIFQESVNGRDSAINSKTFTSDKDGNIVVDLGQATNSTRKIKFAEDPTAVPDGYLPSTGTYRLDIDASGNYSVEQFTTVTGADGKSTPTYTNATTTSPDGVVQVDANNNITFGDKRAKTTTSFFIKKVDQSTGKAITTNLNGASFSANEITLSGSPSMGDHPVADTGLTDEIVTSSLDTDLRLVKINETIAPTGYTKSDTPYYVTLSPDDGVVGVSTKAQTVVGQKTSEDGVVKIEDSKTIDFADAAQVNTFSMKKTDASDEATPATGKFTFHVIPVNSNNGQPTGAAAFDVTVTDGQITNTTMPSDMTSGMFVITETDAPSTWKKEPSRMYFTWSPDQGVTGVGDDLNTIKSTPAKDPGGLQMMKIDTVNGKGVLNYSDEKVAESTGGDLVIKKVDASDTSKSLPGAKFTIETVTLGMNASYGKPVDVTTDANGEIKYPVTDPSYEYFRVTETAAPDGYKTVSQPYIVHWENGKVTGFGTSTGNTKPQTGVQWQASMDASGALVVQDPVIPVVKFKKVSSLAGNPVLPNAKFTVTETTVNGSVYTGTDKQTQKQYMSDGNGYFQFTPSATQVGSTHYYKITEDVAPLGYKKGAETWVVYKVGTGVLGVKTKDATTPSDAVGPMTVGKSYITYTDEPQTFDIQVRRQLPPSGKDTLPSFEKISSSVSIYVQRTDGVNTTTYTTNTDVATGNATINIAAMMQQLKLEPSATTKSTSLKIYIPTTTPGGYTVPVPRVVNFTWGTDVNAGFSVDTNHQDSMVVDSTKSDAENVIPRGDLRMQVRRDTLVARSSTADVSGDFTRIPNATFKLEYVGYGSQTVTTNPDSGVVLIQEPSETANVPLNTPVKVIMTPVNTPDGYEPLSVDAINLTYNSSVGFTLSNPSNFALASPQLSPKDGMPDDDMDSGQRFIDTATGVSTDQYSFGGTQITVPFVPQNKLSLNSAPQVMNFGHAQVLSGVQTLDLLPKSTDSSKLANFDLSTLTDTDDQATSTVTDADDFLKAQVTQVGTYNSGWQLKMAMSTLTSEDGSDSITGGSVTMGTPKVTKDTGTTDLNMGMSKTVDMNGSEPQVGTTKITDYADPEDLVNTGNNSTAGVYNIAWNVNDVKMNLPAMVGKLNTNYQSTMSWALTWAP